MNFLKKINEIKFMTDEAQRLILQNPYNAAAMNMIMVTRTYMEMVEVWKRVGMKTFRLSKELIHAFNHTDIPLDFCPNDFRYPFDSFLIEGDAPFFMTDYIGGAKPVECILYSNERFISNNTNAIMIDSRGNKVNKLLSDHSIHAFFPASREGCENIMLNLTDNMTIKSCVEAGPAIGYYPADKSDLTGLCNILFNTVLYINDPTRIINETESRESRKVKLSGKETVRQQYIYLRPPKSYRATYEASGKTLDIRFMVRGHWRNQAIGVGRKDHKRIWIKPHWKGPEMSDIVGKKYLVK